MVIPYINYDFEQTKNVYVYFIVEAHPWRHIKTKHIFVNKIATIILHALTPKLDFNFHSDKISQGVRNKKYSQNKLRETSAKNLLGQYFTVLKKI